MSVNNLIHREWVHELKAFQDLIDEISLVAKNATTLEERLLTEHHLIERFQELKDLNDRIEKVTSFDHPEFEHFAKEDKLILDVIKMNVSRLTSLTEMYLEYFNSSKTSFLGLNGAFRRTNQKLATLKLWDRSKAKYFISEAFYNLDQIDNSNLSLPVANINTSNGFVTLPISEKKILEINKVQIASGSTGVPGNTSIREVVTENRLPQFMFDGSADTWFEYEAYDRGPLVLKIEIDFPSPKIVNGIEIEPVISNEACNFVLEDISMTRDDGRTFGKSKLLSPALDDDYFDISVVGNDSSWEVATAPVSCIRVSLTFVQNHSVFVTTPTPDGRYIPRERFSINIRKILLKQIKYEPEGSVGSKMQGIPQGMYGAACILHAYPRNLNLYDLNMNVSLDGGENWEKDVAGLPSPEGQTMLVNGDSLDCIWNLDIKRSDKAFKDAVSFDDEEPRLPLDSLLLPVSTNITGPQVPLKTKPYNKTVFCMHPRVARRTSNVREAKNLGSGFISPESVTDVYFPINIGDLGLDPSDLRIYANNVEWARVYDPTFDDGVPNFDPGKLGYGRYYLDPAGDFVRFHPASADSLNPANDAISVKYSFSEEQMHFMVKSDGYYSVLSNLFDPDKENIKIKRLPTDFKKKNMMLPLMRERINLEHKYIREFKLDAEEGGSDVLLLSCSNYAELAHILKLKQADPSSVYTYDGTDYGVDTPDVIFYYLDSINGILHLNQKLNTQIRVSYSHATPIVLDKTEYEIWADEETSEPGGLIVSPSAFNAEDVEDVLYHVDEAGHIDNIHDLNFLTAPKAVMNIQSGIFEPRVGFTYDSNGDITGVDDPFNSSGDRSGPNDKLNVFTLSQNNIVENSLLISSEILGYENHPAPTEVAFIDGATEFKGLKEMENEITPKIEADEYGFVSFNLAGGPNYASEWGVNFDKDGLPAKQINTTKLADGTARYPSWKSGDTLRQEIIKKLNNGESLADLTYQAASGAPEDKGTLSFVGYGERALWALDSSGTVTVFIGEEKFLEPGVSIRYSYVDPAFDSKNLYSVDYQNGILYLSEPLDLSKTRVVSYKTANYSVSYDIAVKVESYDYDPEQNVVSVKTENISTESSDIFSLVKIVWALAPSDVTLDKLKDYFSPIIYRTGIRFQ